MHIDIIREFLEKDCDLKVGLKNRIEFKFFGGLSIIKNDTLIYNDEIAIDCESIERIKVLPSIRTGKILN